MFFFYVLGGQLINGFRVGVRSHDIIPYSPTFWMIDYCVFEVNIIKMILFICYYYY